MNDQSTNFVEYSYDKKVDGKDKLKRVLYFILVGVLMLIPSYLIAAYAQPFLAVIPLVLFIGVPLAKFFFRYLQNEFKYTIDRSSFKMELIHGKAKPKLIYSADIREMEFAVPYNAETAERYPDRDFDIIAKCCTSPGSPDLYILAFRDKNGKRVLMYFDACLKALKIMNFYNKKVIVSQDIKH